MDNVAEKGDNVSVDYTGTLENGEVFDTSEGKQPLTFVLGEGRLIPGFENAVLGMKVGETKTVTLKPEEAYGERDERLIQVFPKQAFGENFSLKVGDMIALTDPNSGRQFPAVITEITDDNVTVDLNPRLAGKTLTFKITLVKINEKATKE